ncbi:IS3 family transposase [Guyparkeria sp. GHLCS8-2]|uniref:IS3 family transposase n=1 Tax=Guyparkeria halopsychrophila TaxID=3139421 RepID=UPI0037CAD79D
MRREEKARLINQLRPRHTLKWLLKAAGMSRSVYYYWCRASARPDRYADEKRRIAAIFHQHRGRYGYRRITWTLRRQGHPLNHKTVQRLMGQLGLACRLRPKRYRSYRGEEGKTAPNRLQRQFETDRPNHKWVTDVTEFKVRGERLYLSPILDLYNQEIVSYEIARTPRLPLVMTMLKQAIKRLAPGERPMLHSDQGWQYRMPLYRQTLNQHSIEPSMSRKGNCHDNAVMENFFGILKSECFHGRTFKTVEAFILEIKRYIRYYNHDRIKEKLKGLSPVEYRTQALVPG